MVNPMSHDGSARMELANRLFFRLYQCTNMLHKTGSRAVEAEGLTTQQWAVLGALSRQEAQGGVSIGDLARAAFGTRHAQRERLGVLALRPPRAVDVTPIRAVARDQSGSAGGADALDRNGQLRCVQRLGVLAVGISRTCEERAVAPKFFDQLVLAT